MEEINYYPRKESISLHGFGGWAENWFHPSFGTDAGGLVSWPAVWRSRAARIAHQH